MVSTPQGWNHGDGFCMDHTLDASTTADRSPPSSFAPALVELSRICLLIMRSRRGDRDELLVLHIMLRLLNSPNNALAECRTRITSKAIQCYEQIPSLRKNGAPVSVHFDDVAKC